MLDKFFSYKMMKKFAQHVFSWNTATQVLASYGAADPDMKTTGTALAFINGAPILSLPAIARIDLSATAVCDVAGLSYADGTTLWLLVTENAAGAAKVHYAGITAAAPKIPEFDAENYVPIGWVKLVTSGAAYVVGTTNLDAGTITVTYTQILWPLVPHSDNIDKN